MAQTFESRTGMIISAKVRKVTNSNGDLVDKVIISLDNDTNDIFAPLSAIQGAIDKAIQPSDLRRLVRSDLYYTVSEVKEGDTFKFVSTGEIQDSPASTDLHITTIKGVLPTEKLEEYLESVPDYVQVVDGNTDSSEPETKLDKAELIAELAAITNITGMRAFVDSLEMFDDDNRFDSFTTAVQYKGELATIFEALD